MMLFHLAHEDGIWAVAWRTNENDNTENVITGGIDDLLKVWKWYAIVT